MSASGPPGPLVYLSVLTYVLAAQKNRLIETVLLSTHKICLVWNKKSMFCLRSLKACICSYLLKSEIWSKPSSYLLPYLCM